MLELNVFSVIMISAFIGVMALGTVCFIEELRDIINN